MSVLPAVLFTFLVVVTWRIFILIKGILEYAINSFFLVTLIFDLGLILLGEIRCLSLSRMKWLKGQVAVKELKRKEKPFTIWACSLNQSQVVLLYFLA